MNAPKLEPDCCLCAIEKGKSITSDLMLLGGNQFSGTQHAHYEVTLKMSRVAGSLAFKRTRSQASLGLAVKN